MAQTERSNQIQIGNWRYYSFTLIKSTVDKNALTPMGFEGNQSVIINSQQNDNTIVSRGRIGSDGSVLLLEVGRLEANGKTLNDLRAAVRNILIRNGVSPRFQLEIVDFKSQKSYLTINSKSEIILLDDQKVTIRDILTSANVGINPGKITGLGCKEMAKSLSYLCVNFTV